MDTLFLDIGGQPLSLDEAIEFGNIKGIRSSGEPVGYVHLVDALQQPHHVLEAVVDKMLGQENGRHTIEEVIAHEKISGRPDIARRVVRAVDVHEQGAERPVLAQDFQSRFVALTA